MARYQRVGRALALLRKAAGLRQQDVAERLGLRTSSVGRVENDDVDPRTGTVSRYLLAIERTFSDLELAFQQIESPGLDEGRLQPDGTGLPASLEKDLAWLMREVVDQRRSLADVAQNVEEIGVEFREFRVDVGKKLLHDAAAKSAKKASSAKGGQTNEPPAPK